MKFDIMMQKTENYQITDSFYVYQDSITKEVHWADNIEDMRVVVKNYLVGNNARKEDGTEYSKEELDEIVNNITEEDMEKFEVKFEKPNFNTNSLILARSVSPGNDGKPRIDFVEYNQARIFFLLKDWNYERDGKKVPVTLANLNRLHPNVLEGILNRLNKNIPHYLSMMIA